MKIKFARDYRRTPVAFVWVALLLTALMNVPGVCAQTLPRAQPEEVGLSSERLKRLSNTLREYSVNNKLPGGVVRWSRFRGHQTLLTRPPFLAS